MRKRTLEIGWGMLHLEEIAKDTNSGPGIKLQKGDTVMIFSPNSLAYPVMLHGAFAAGLRVTLANTAYTPGELKHQYTDSGASAIFVHADMLPIVLQMLQLCGVEGADARRRIIIAEWPGTGTAANRLPGYLALRSLLSGKALPHEVRFDGPAANETALLCYSSGTTGRAKGVMTTHRNLTSLCCIISPLFTPTDASPNPETGLTKDVMLGVLPFYHIYGAVKLLHWPYTTGLPVVIMPRFDIVKFVSLIERWRCTISLIVPPILLALVHHPVVDKYDISSLRIMFSGAAPLGAPLANAVRQRLMKANGGKEVVITQGYGLTETSPTSHLLQDKEALRKVGSIGQLLPNLEARLVNDDGEDAEEGERGELWTRGPTVMKGYINNPEATADAITPDGWFKTGDVCIRDSEGFYTIVDRKKELIKYKGFQVPPAELESTLLQHPEIVDAAVIGVNSVKEATELPRAYVVPANKALLEPSASQEREAFGRAVQKWIEGRVAKHKYLRGGVVVIDVVPKSAAGKILRRELRERAKKELSEVKAKL
ncbi:acetyl-CoA synthetase-like protein [Punctularia strigosozonata HHB-11173 SS5]|uniref:acetyl-CoA synthetase-like protein n=1 Tax=Punctularia strigosozonata (strain HHB-11173) TaxID=741275 RepID=UPI00044168AE|nr:acetyl-CoA synthetase-like protein [Punctularia strigosozonata HHB-11173 SS5]EIN06725.1 acetyl-CoA synthetase-like protein [Punctularia strigosozonata HHB-11173 SS5]